MDPVAHTLFGAALAESGLKRRSRYATATLLIGANLPDIDVVAGLWGDDFELYMRRGHTHGVLALILLPLLLAGAVALWHRWRGRAPPAAGAAGEPAPAFSPKAILLLAFLGVWSHPLLDWLNTYGVRLLMPFDARWFYGDTLFIVDPWFWLLTASGVVLVRSRKWPAMALWSLLALSTTVLVLTTNLVPIGVKLAWCAGIAAIVTLRALRPGWALRRPFAQFGLAGLIVYLGFAYGLARMAESAAADRFPDARQVQANPAPGTPGVHRLVVVEEDLYRLIAEDGTVQELPRLAPDAIVRRAMADPSIRGFVNWMRYPYWTVEDAGDAWRVTFHDLRYQGPDVANPRDIGFAQVSVPKGTE